MTLDRLQRAVPVVDQSGVPSIQFQALWQRTVESIEASLGSLQEQLDLIQAAQDAADAANAAAVAAQTAADNADTAATAAQGAADDAAAATAIASSYVTGLTLTATDAGSNVTVNISAHTRVYADGTSVSVSAGSVTGLSYSLDYYIYYDQASRAGGAVTYQATTSQTTAAQVGDRHTVGKVTTPAAAAPDNNGDPVLPPGVGNIAF